MAAMGSRLQTYIAWNWHCQDDGLLDFAGPGRNLSAFFETAQNLNMQVLLRPGPFICVMVYSKQLSLVRRWGRRKVFQRVVHFSERLLGYFTSLQSAGRELPYRLAGEWEIDSLPSEMYLEMPELVFRANNSAYLR